MSIYDPEYLRANIEGGEYFDWYYASATARKNQVRTPIADPGSGAGASSANEPWIYRQKDIRNWWRHTHHNRPGGVRSGSTTAWNAQSKPIWFTELGCPAVDKGTNQPNVFWDPKSSESFFPHYSSGQRDDFIQRLYCEVMLAYWRDEAPTSTVTNDPMVRPEDMYLWTWDSRPFPDFPMRTKIWADGKQWQKGHWVTGRIESAVLARLVERLCLEVGLLESQIDVSGLYGPGGLVRGMVLNTKTDQRSILENLATAFQFDAFESGGKLKFVMGLNTRTITIEAEDLVLPEGQAFPVTISRAQETDLPRAAKITYLDELNAYATASVDGQMGTGSSQNVTTAGFPIVMEAGFARSLANSLVHRSWTARESGEFALPPSYAALEPGDAIYLPVGSRLVGAQVRRLDIGVDRKIAFAGFDASLFTTPPFPEETRLPLEDATFSSIRLLFLDIPLLSETETQAHAPRLAAFAEPWPGACAVYRDDGAGGIPQGPDRVRPRDDR